MRSRYSACVLGLADYLLATWHPGTRPQRLDLAEPTARRTTWLGLSIERHVRSGDEHAMVEFVARYRVGGARARRLHERSRFVREDFIWHYLDGEIVAQGDGPRRAVAHVLHGGGRVHHGCTGLNGPLARCAVHGIGEDGLAMAAGGSPPILPDLAGARP